MNPSPSDSVCPEHLRIDDCVPMVHVADVDVAEHFYGLLGFQRESRYQREDGVTNFSGLRSGKARLFLTRASEPIIPSEQAVLFYMYSDDVTGLRRHLLAKGLEDGGLPPGFRKHSETTNMPERNAVYTICHPFYMPEGELRVHDRDGYVILVGQLG